MSCNSQYYGITGKEEAEAYLVHSVLGVRLRKITSVFLQLKDKTVQDCIRRIRYNESVILHDTL